MPLSSKAFYLVSASPRRQELLHRLGIEPVVAPVDLEEFHDPALSPEALTISLSAQKMDAFLALNGDFQGVEDKEVTLLTADTIVHVGGEHLGKPKNRDDAERMLHLLSGKEHRVSTGFILQIRGERWEEVVSTVVHFHELSDRDIDFYLDSEEWHDAAGAYKIQGRGEIMINWIKGSWSNVMGLPISRIYAILRDENYWTKK
jgi:septum formation protein